MKTLFVIFVSSSLFCASCVQVQQQTGNTNLSSPRPQLQTPSPTQTPVADRELSREIAEIAKETDGKVGVYAVEIETGKSAALNENGQYPMQSVVKLPIAMTVLKQVDDGRLKLDQMVNVYGDDMTSTNQRSPIRDNNPNGTQMTLEELLKAAVSESDGTAADVLQRVVGGAKSVQGYVESLGIDNIKIKFSHKEFGSEWSRQYENWATPKATVDLLRTLWDSSASTASGSDGGTSQKSSKLLMHFMTESHNPDNRLLGMLPTGTVVAHKTGTGGTQDGITSAINDVGIITLPDGKHVAIAVYIQDSSHKGEKASELIAKIAKAVFAKWSTIKMEPAKGANSNDRHTLNKESNRT